MTQLLNRVLPSYWPDAIATAAISAAATPRKLAEQACAPFFARVAPVAPLDAEDRDAIIDAVAKVARIRSDGPINPSVRPSAHLQILAEGWTYRAQILADGARQITDIMLPGDFWDHPSAKSRDPAHCLRACGPVRVALLRKDDLGPALPAFRRIRDWASYAEAGVLRSRLVSLGRRNARDRVAYLMPELHERLSRVGLVDRSAFSCPLTQTHVADALGLTSVHVNRVLQILRIEGLVVFNKRRVFIPDVAHLHAVAGYEDNACAAKGGDGM